MTDNPEMDAITARIVDDAVSRLNAANLSTPFRVASTTVVSWLKQRRRYEDRIASVEHIGEELYRIQEVLVLCATELREAEREVGERDPGSNVWWNHRNQLIAQGLHPGGEAESALKVWRQTWREGLSMRSWQDCEKLLARSDLPPEVEPSRQLMSTATAALRTLDDVTAYQALKKLRRDPHGLAWTATLGLWAIRLLLAADTDPRAAAAEARRFVHEVEDAASSGDDTTEEADHWRGVAAASLAEAYLVSGDLPEARAALDGVVGEPDCPADAYIVAGMVAEAEGDFDEADQYYEQALQADPRAADQPSLLEPIVSRLTLAASHNDGRPLADRVGLLRRAIEEGVTGPGDEPVREVYLELAETTTALATELELAGRTEEAQQARFDSAEPYAEAGKRYSWAGLNERATELLRTACELAPKVASHHWNLAETLRQLAVDDNGLLDVSLALEARSELEEGLRLATPTAEDPWVLVTQGMLERELDDADSDPAIAVERSLALALTPSPDGTPGDWYALGYGFLAQTLRLRGWLSEALEVARQGVDIDTNESFVFRELIWALIELGKHEKALERIDFQRYRQPEDASLQGFRGMILHRQGKQELALEELDGLGTDEWVRYERATAYETLGLTDKALSDKARAEFRTIYREATDESDPAIVAWAAFRSGRLDDAVATYEHAIERASNDVRGRYGLGLGQMLLARGDVEGGRDQLVKNVAASCSPDDLLVAVAREFPVLRTVLRGTAHEDAALATLEAVERAAAERVGDLRSRRRKDLAAVNAVEARTAIHGQQWLEAVAAYTELASTGSFPEASGAIRFAMIEALRTADSVYRSGDREKARNWWTGLEPAASGAASTGNADLLVSLTCRRILLQVVEGDVDRIDLTLLSRLLTTAYVDLDEAAGVLACDIETYWALRIGLAGLTDDDRLDQEAVRAVARLIEGLPIDAAYDVTDLLESSMWSASFVSPLLLAMGVGLSEVAEDPELDDALVELQDEISDDMGVRVPWVDTQVAPGLEPDEAQLQVFERPVRRALFTSTAPDVADVMGQLVEGTIRDYLFRLVGVDDVGLWLEGWDLSRSDAPAWSPADPVPERLRLARVLRMLLREGVRVSDRATIVGRLGDSSRRDETLQALHDVRLALPVEDLRGTDATEPAYLPETLERRVGAGLDRGGTVWELDRPAALALVLDLRAWLADSGHGARAVAVHDARLRPFVWRLLASESPRVRVLSAEELS